MMTSRSYCSPLTQSIKCSWNIYLLLVAVITIPTGCAGGPANFWDASDTFERSSQENNRPWGANRERHQREAKETHRAEAYGTRDQDPKAPSQILNESGVAQVGHQMPFFSGWLTDGHVLNLTGLLETKKSRYVITMCASWCAPCFDGLQRLSEAQAEFQGEDTKLVIYVVDTELEAKKIQRRFNFDWALVLSDPFQSHARKLSSNKSAQRSKTGGMTIELPRTFVLNQEGTVEMIIGQEGNDYIGRLLTERD